jgi:hypothetical protein
MSLFDYYRPKASFECSTCGLPLVEWQGKDGPNSMFVWAEGIAQPVGQLVGDADLRASPDDLARVRLPRRFTIYSYGCPEHQPIEADCEAPAGVWNRTTLRPVSRSPR